VKPWLWVAALVSVIAGVLVASHSSSLAPSGGGAVVVDATPVPLNPRDTAQDAVGAFRYAGGLVLSSRQTERLHGLSDLEIAGTDRLTAIGDIGDRFEARLLFDSAARLVGMTDAEMWPLTGDDGRPLASKAEADAEGLARLPGGDLLVSFERHSRIWLYPADGGLPRPVPMPQVSFPLNEGMEALAADPEAGDDAYVVGGEMSGETWTCRISATCTKGPTVAMPAEFGLVALKRLPAMATVYLLRAFDPAIGNRISLQLFRGGVLVDRMDLARPLTIDNFEGVAAVPRRDGGLRFYLLSDDNASASQRTLLLAFDWQPH
jgi:hypothetical protein